MKVQAALSDAKQQVTPSRLTAILDEIVWRHADTADKEFAQSLESLRGNIDELDRRLIEVLANRMNYVDEIAHLKKKSDVTILQVSRYHKMLEDRILQAKNKNINPDFIKGIFEVIHQNSIKRQEAIMNAD